jgi:hypothetical protein
MDASSNPQKGQCFSPLIIQLGWVFRVTGSILKFVPQNHARMAILRMPSLRCCPDRSGLRAFALQSAKGDEQNSSSGKLEKLVETFGHSEEIGIHAFNALTSSA